MDSANRGVFHLQIDGGHDRVLTTVRGIDILGAIASFVKAGSFISSCQRSTLSPYNPTNMRSLWLAFQHLNCDLTWLLTYLSNLRVR